ncbi:MAG: hypothetical protein FJ143_08885, partial [Deltaproteobacteria bacterium]|nr:hypothetical protein [Deltaproteobacteria bacterium]
MNRRQNKARRCSFCEKGEQGDTRLITSPGVAICGECFDLCVEIVAEERKSKRAQRGGWESWSGDAFKRDIIEFYKSQGRLVGMSERRLVRRLGPPEEITSGMKVY